MARLFSADENEAIASLDAIEGATFTPVTGASAVVEYLTLDLGVQAISPHDASMVDITDQITVRVSELDEDDLLPDSSFDTTGVETGPRAGVFRVTSVAEKDEHFITANVRRD